MWLIIHGEINVKKGDTGIVPTASFETMPLLTHFCILHVSAQTVPAYDEYLTFAF